VSKEPCILLCNGALWKVDRHQSDVNYKDYAVKVSKVKVFGYSCSQSDLPHRHGNSHAIRDHTVLPAIRQR